MRPLVALGPLVLVGVLSACSDPAATVDDGPDDASSTGAMTRETCAALVPDAVFADLGWVPTGSATPDELTCTREATEGQVSVQRRALAYTGPDDRAAAARTAWEQRCDEVGAMVDRAAGIAPEAAASCALVADRGPDSVLVLRTGDDDVLEIRVAPRADTPVERIEAGLRALATAATAS
ncbi:hypothetical protein FHP29_10600 [Nocardioides albidus]|uniref:DUF3558 domain-containing protein n=1 Tax=Nocardioides albidus TaxID=1517589 RepID=A0A5C4VX89_9ACTN|nr:hypothetical protein [Nocardioides albidus]TNM40488.1 hypothetical protein FHP29_10600 [Nocardioides albidus]